MEQTIHTNERKETVKAEYPTVKLLKLSASNIDHLTGGVGIVAYADFPYVVGYDDSGQPAVDSIRAEVWFTSESGLLRPWLRCQKCGKQHEHLYMTMDQPQCAECADSQ